MFTSHLKKFCYALVLRLFWQSQGFGAVVLGNIKLNLFLSQGIFSLLSVSFLEQAAKLEKLENQVNDVETMKEKLKAQATELKSIKTQPDVTTNQVETLRRDKEVGQVAFSASLLTSGSGHTGPYNAYTPLVFRHVISNIGNAYSPTTGLFTAPVRGACHFEFYIAALGSTHDSGAALLKNEEHVIIAYETEANSWGQSANGATLLLEADDVMSLRLWVHTRIYENVNRHNMFSGRLLFTK